MWTDKDGFTREPSRAGPVLDGKDVPPTYPDVGYSQPQPAELHPDVAYVHEIGGRTPNMVFSAPHGAQPQTSIYELSSHKY